MFHHDISVCEIAGRNTKTSCHGGSFVPPTQTAQEEHDKKCHWHQPNNIRVRCDCKFSQRYSWAASSVQSHAVLWRLIL